MKRKKPCWNSCAFGQNEENFENLQENIEIFIRISRAIDFSQIVLNIYQIADSSPNLYTPGRYQQFSTTIFCDFVEEDIPEFPHPPAATDMGKYICYIDISDSYLKQTKVKKMKAFAL